MEQRQLLSTTPLHFGAVYIEQDLGNDQHGDALEITFVGGAANTELTRLVIRGDQGEPGFGVGDVFFDTVDSGRGADHAFPVTVLSQDGIDHVAWDVQDGTSDLVFDFQGFHAGERLVFTIDVDEVEDYDPDANDLVLINDGFDPITSGVEFQGSQLSAHFTAPHFQDTNPTTEFFNRYDDRLEGTGLDLPLDDEGNQRDRTAGAVGAVVQQPKPVSISGTVYEEIDLDLSQDPGENGIPGVKVSLWRQEGDTYVDTGHRTTTDGQGRYEFGRELGLLPGVYQIRETQPPSYFSVGAIPGTVDHSPSGTAVAGDPNILTQIEIPLGDLDAVDYDFAEARAAEISGTVYHDRDDDGARDPGEEGIPGVTVEIIALETVAEQEKMTVATDANGFYEATGLAPGSYRVVQPLQPPGYFDGKDRAGTVAGKPSGEAVNPGDRIDNVFLGGGQRGIDYNFGELRPASIGGRVQLTRGDGGCFDPTTDHEPIAGVTVELRDAAGNRLQETKTDALGNYEFTGLHPGVYAVIEHTPDGLFDGGANAGTVGSSRVGRVEGPGVISGIAVGSDDQAVDYDFCERPPASIGGFVYHDRNQDGSRAPDEEPIADVTITLLDADGDPVATGMTDDRGHYEFTGLPAGRYTLVETQPAGWLDGQESVGTIDGQRVGVSLGANDQITDVDLRWGDQGRDYDFGELRSVSIRGSVYLSYDDGDCRGGGPGTEPLAGVTLVLRNEAGDVVDRTVTDADGQYRFEDLDPGVYSVSEITPSSLIDGGEFVGTVDGVPTGRVVANDTIGEIAIGSGQSGIGYDFCEHPTATLSGTVYHDRNNDGLHSEAEEAIAGVQVLLLDAGGRQVLDSRATDAQGHYEFTGLAAGTYVVREVQPAGWLDGLETPGTVGGKPIGVAMNPGDEIRAIQLGWGDQGRDYNFGEQLPGSVAGLVHTDIVRDCIFAPEDGERGLAGVRLDLLDAAGHVVQTTATDARGQYRFDHVAPGEYAVREHQPDGLFDGGQRAGSGGGNVNLPDLISAIHVGSDQHLVDYDFCEEPPVSISGFVFQDGPTVAVLPGETLPENVQKLRDGRLTPDDVRLPGVTLRLGNGLTGLPIYGDQALPGRYDNRPLVTTTDANGYYEFGGLRRGTYAVFEVHPDGFVDGIDTAGTQWGVVFNVGEPVDPLVSQFLQVDPENDAIVRIGMPPGSIAQHNNFSEIRVSHMVVPPPPAPPTTPIPPPPPPTTVLTPDAPIRNVRLAPMAVPRDFESLGGSGVPYTWHLSVVDAGHPRGDGIVHDGGGAIWLATTRRMPDTAQLSEGTWRLPDRGLDPSQAPTRTYRFGMPGAIPISGDFNGDGRSEIGVFYRGHWYIDVNANGTWDEDDLWAQLGDGRDLPVTGDWDGDGKDDIGIFGPVWPGDRRALEREPGLPDNQSTPTGELKNVPPNPEEATSRRRLLQLASSGPTRADLIDHVFHYGILSDYPVVGDWNGDGIQSVGIFRNGRWYLDVDGDGRWSARDRLVEFGQQGDLPITGDFNGDGVDEIGIYRDGVIYLDSNGNRKLDDQDRLIRLSDADARPVVGDWNGDGKDDIAVYHDGRPAKESRVAETPPRKEPTHEG